MQNLDNEPFSLDIPLSSPSTTSEDDQLPSASSMSIPSALGRLRSACEYSPLFLSCETRSDFCVSVGHPPTVDSLVELFANPKHADFNLSNCQLSDSLLYDAAQRAAPVMAISLDLSGNDIHTLSFLAFFPVLNQLSLGHNPITTLRDINDSIPCVSSLQYLDLTACGLSNIDCCPLPRLRFLSVTGNLLTNLDEISGLFPRLRQLQAKDMTSLTGISSSFLRLSFLDISGCVNLPFDKRAMNLSAHSIVYSGITNDQRESLLRALSGSALIMLNGKMIRANEFVEAEYLHPRGPISILANTEGI